MQSLQNDTKTDDMLLKAITTIQNGDEEGFRALFWEGRFPENEQNSAIFAKMQECFNGELVSWKKTSQDREKNYSSGMEIVTCDYQVVIDNNENYVKVVRAADKNQSLLQMFSVTPEASQPTATTLAGNY